MTKRIVICCDGTWNTPDQTADGRVTPTNVTKVAAAVAESDSTGMDQLVYYQPGVGTSPWERIRGGAFGVDDGEYAHSHLCFWHAHLPSRITFTESHSAVGKCLEVNCRRKWNSQFIRTGITATKCSS